MIDFSIDRQAVLLDIEVTNKTELFALLIAQLKKSDYISNEKEVLKSVLAREEVRATGLANGVACPHAKTSGVTKSCIAVARLSTPIDFQSSDGILAKHVFLILSPKDQTGNPHIAVLSSVVSCYRNPVLLEKLDKASTQAEYHNLLTGCPDDEES